MPSSFSTDLKLELMVTGENAGTWGTKTNTNLNLLQQAIAGYQEVSIAGGAQTTALTMDNAAISNARNAVIKFTGTITGNQIVTIPNGIEKTYTIFNGTTGAFTVQFKTASGTGPTFSTTDKGIKLVYSDGTNVVDILTGPLSNVTIGSNLSVDGGTIKLDGNYPVGTNNVALGNGALDDGSLTGGCNVAIGNNVLTANTTASDNTAVGSNSLVCNTTGLCNTAVGSCALNNNTTGLENVGIGVCALELNTTGCYNTAVGGLALKKNTTAGQNTAVGYYSLLCNTTACNNTAVGYSSLLCNTTGCQNTAVGSLALDANTTANSNTAIGYVSLSANTTGTLNTAVGAGSLQVNTTGTGNIAVGFGSLECNTTGVTNTAVGVQTLCANTTGSDNVALGRCALKNNTTATGNTAIGIASMFNTTTGGNNVAIGSGALECNISNTDNVAVGRCALQNNKGDANTMVGPATGNNLTTGCYNTYVGAYHAGSAVGVLFEYIYGYSATGKGSNTFFVNAINGSYNGGNTTTWTQTSDRRIKKNITDNNDGLEKIKKIRVRNFEYRKPEEITELPTHSAIIKEGVQLGVISQEVQEILPNMIKEESTGVLSFNSDNLIWYLVNAIKELTAKVEALENKS